jgi:hypothetical protein
MLLTPHPTTAVTVSRLVRHLLDGLDPAGMLLLFSGVMGSVLRLSFSPIRPTLRHIKFPIRIRLRLMPLRI